MLSKLKNATLKNMKADSINDIDLKNWKEYKEILTDSLWILDKRDSSGAHSANYWGNFIPQIPQQLLKRYTKKNDWVLDCFLGSGTTLMECQRLGRNGIGIELQAEISNLAKKNIDNDKDSFQQKSKIEVITADSRTFDYQKKLTNLGIEAVQLVIMHPPYWDIIQFSKNEKDLSNSPSLEHFLKIFGKIIDKVEPILEHKRYLALVIGDKYANSEWLPLGFYSMQEILKRNFKLKSIIVKNFKETKAKQNQQSLWRYRALAGGFYLFKHEYIFLFEKK